MDNQRINLHFKWVQGENIDSLLQAIEEQVEMPPFKRSKSLTKENKPVFESSNGHLRIITDRKNVITIDPLNNLGEKMAEPIIYGLAMNSPSFTHMDAHPIYK